MDQGGRSGTRIVRLQALGALGFGLFAYRRLFWLPESGFLANFESWLFEPGREVLLPVLLGAAWLLWRRWGIFIELPRRRSPLLAALCLGCAAALYAWSARSGSVTLLLPSLSALGAGFAALRAGPAGCRALALPLVFPLVALPIPAPLRHQLVWTQQEATASITASVLAWLGVAVHSEGILIQRPSILFIVIESCSGFRFAMAFGSLGLLIRGLAPPSTARAVLMTAAGIVTGLLLNEARVLWIVITSSSWAASSDHALQGLVALMFGVPILLGLHRLSGGAGERRPRAPAPLPPGPAEGESRGVGWGPALGVLGLFAAMGLLLSPPGNQRAPALDLSGLPAAKEEWDSALLATDFLLLGSVRFDQVLRRGYQHHDGTRVELFIGSVGSGDPQKSPFSPVTALPETGWVVLEREPAEIAGRLGERLVLASPGMRSLAYTWRIGDSGLWIETLRAALALPPGRFGGPLRRTVVRVSTHLELEGPADRARAERRLRDFVETFLPGLDGVAGS